MTRTSTQAPLPGGLAPSAVGQLTVGAGAALASAQLSKGRKLPEDRAGGGVSRSTPERWTGSPAGQGRACPPHVLSTGAWGMGRT